MAKRAQTRKGSKKAKKGTRKLSPALREWNQKVMAIYREMKKKNPNTRLMDAMKEAKKRS
jgi:5-formyltetrahydrofolate cyclo-ligase